MDAGAPGPGPPPQLSQSSSQAQSNKKRRALSLTKASNVPLQLQRDSSLAAARKTMQLVPGASLAAPITPLSVRNVPSVFRKEDHTYPLAAKKTKPAMVSILRKVVQDPPMSEAVSSDTSIDLDDLSDEDFQPKMKKMRDSKRQEQLSQQIKVGPNDQSHKSIAEEIIESLPNGYKYQIKDLQVFENPLDFIATIRVNITEKKQVDKWMKEMEALTMTNFRRECGKENTAKIVYKKKFRCHQNTRASLPSSKTKKAHAKHNNCPALIIMTIQDRNMRWSKEEFLQDYPCQIYLKNLHNHRINCADALKHRKPTEEVIKQFKDMFNKSHSPASALESFKFDLQEEHGPSYFRVAADGAKCPSLRSFYHLYYTMFKEAYGAPNGTEMIASLEKFIQEYNDKHKDTCAIYEQVGDDLIVAIASPLMKRVLTNLKGSGEMMFMDSGGGMDRHNSKVFVMVAPSVAGALPDGVLIVTSEKESVIARALELFKSIIPENSFCGRGKEAGPKLVMTDNSTPERDGIHEAFPHAILLLCIFHVLQAFWRYLWNAEHKVAKEDRTHIYDVFHTIVYAKDEETFNRLFDELITDSTVVKNPKLLNHLKDLRDTAMEWALCFRSDLLTRGHTTDNYSEATIRILKDNVFCRTKAFSVVQLFDFLTTKLDAYFMRRIQSVITNRMASYTSSRYYIDENKLKNLTCLKVENTENVYVVKNEEKGTSYTVNTEVEICSCPVGDRGAPCKHQMAIVKAFNLSSNQFLPFADGPAKKHLHFIMTGEQAPDEFYESFRFEDSRNPRTEDQEVAHEINNGDQGCELEQIVTEAEKTDDENDIIEAKNAEIMSRISNMCDDLKGRVDLKANPALAESIETFLKRYDECKSCDSSLQHALSTFNRFKGHVPTASEKATVKRVHGTKRIPVNNTSVARRVNTVMGGRRAQISGRPCKNSRKEINYCKEPSQPNWMRPAPKRNRAPHDLAHCVSQNVRLGQN